MHNPVLVSVVVAFDFLVVGAGSLWCTLFLYTMWCFSTPVGGITTFAAHVLIRVGAVDLCRKCNASLTLSQGVMLAFVLRVIFLVSHQQMNEENILLTSCLPMRVLAGRGTVLYQGPGSFIMNGVNGIGVPSEPVSLDNDTTLRWEIGSSPDGNPLTYLDGSKQILEWGRPMCQEYPFGRIEAEFSDSFLGSVNSLSLGLDASQEGSRRVSVLMDALKIRYGDSESPTTEKVAALMANSEL